MITSNKGWHSGISKERRSYIGLPHAFFWSVESENSSVAAKSKILWRYNSDSSQTQARWYLVSQSGSGLCR